MKTNFNLLQAIRTRYVSVVKMIPLSVKIRDRLFEPLTLNNILSQGRITKLAWRIRLTKRFFDFILKYAAAHGAPAAVKWLKASLVALQKELGQDRLDSLLPLGTGLAFSRTAGGLPRIIPALCRARIRKGDVKEIRFWTGLFNLYRLLKVPGELKISTITAPFKGNLFAIGEYFTLLENKKLFFDRVKGFERIRQMELSPKSFVLSRAASPSSKVSALGIMTDVYLLNKHQPDLWQEMLYYLYAVKPKVTPFVKDLDEIYQMINRILEFNGKTLPGVISGKESIQHNFLQLKASLKLHGFNGPEGEGLSQFATKEEAAGKIRLFALLDSITQSVLCPLHDLLFALLKAIPNDGTFNQEESIRRSQEKAKIANCAFSFDLTAATDRLPAALTAFIIQTLTGKEIGESWLSIMTRRNFWFNSKVAEKLKVPKGPYQYAVGQPMGGLSSWAGLAITHHWIVQVAAYRATNSYTWNTSYEVLGDDLVIFDPRIADEYLKVMAELGCEINTTKSIVSRNRPVFEFAKRTCWGENIVSGISMAQVRAGWRVAGRVANALAFANNGLITSPSLLATVLSRYAFNNGKSAAAIVFSKERTMAATKLLALSTLSLFGTFYQQGKMSLKTLMTALVNPHYADADYSGEAVGLPLRASLEVAYGIMTSNSEANTDIEWSGMEARTEVYEEYAPELATVMLQSALKKARKLYENYELYVQKFGNSLVTGPYYTEDGVTAANLDDLPEELQLLYAQLHNLANSLLGLEFTKEHPEELYEYLYELAYKHAKSGDRLVKFDEAARLLDRVEQLEFKLSLPEKEAPGRTILESAPILGALRNMDPNRTISPTYNLPAIHRELTTV